MFSGAATVLVSECGMETATQSRECEYRERGVVSLKLGIHRHIRRGWMCGNGHLNLPRNTERVLSTRGVRSGDCDHTCDGWQITRAQAPRVTFTTLGGCCMLLLLSDVELTYSILSEVLYEPRALNIYG